MRVLFLGVITWPRWGSRFFVGPIPSTAARGETGGTGPAVDRRLRGGAGPLDTDPRTDTNSGLNGHSAGVGPIPYRPPEDDMPRSRAGRTIHAWRSSGVNAPGYSHPTVQQPQQGPTEPMASPRLPAAHRAPHRPEDARTLDEAVQGLLSAAAPKLVAPRFRDTSGPWIKVGADQVRVPRDVIVSVVRARNGRSIGVVAHLDSSPDAGRVQVLVETTEGVRELVGIPTEHLRELRQAHFAR